MTPTGRRYLLAIAILVSGLFVLAGAAIMILDRPGAPQPSGIGGPFSVAGTNGKTITQADLQGRPTLIFFGFTNCPDICPTALAEVSAVFDKLGPKANVAAWFVTVDPERDTVAKLKDYLGSFDPRIVGLVGDPQMTQTLQKHYRVYAKKVPLEGGGYTMDHTAIVYLMDTKGRFVNAFNLDRNPEEAAKELARYL